MQTAPMTAPDITGVVRIAVMLAASVVNRLLRWLVPDEALR